MSKKTEHVLDLTEIFLKGKREPVHQLAMLDQYGDEWEGYSSSIEYEDMEELTIYSEFPYEDYLDDCF